ncbi:MAG TPA: subclass B3 metallo-beta-lactamase, partial [Thermoanaerobaculia bacterium]
MKRLRILPLLILAASLYAQTPGNQPVEPFRIAGNLYYLGASDVTSFLITTPAGHIVIDGGYEEMAPGILENIKRLGFRPQDVRILLNSHAHFDHAGGLTALQGATGAQFIASRGDAPILKRGGHDDPQFRDRFHFPPIVPDRLVDDGDTVTLGGTTLTARITPGHTPGCTTWLTTIRDGEHSYNVVFIGSPSVPSEYNLTTNRRYPNAVA